jgi:hypothetical protein
MYRFISAISILIRGCYLPNPFEHYAYSVFPENSVYFPVYHAFEPYLIQAVFELFMRKIAFSISGVFYDGYSKAEGSFLYLISYIMCNGITCCLCIYGFRIGHMIAALIVLLIIAICVKNRLDEAFL